MIETNDLNNKSNYDIIPPYNKKCQKMINVKDILKTGELNNDKKSILDETLSLSILQSYEEPSYKPRVLHKFVQDQNYSNSLANEIYTY